MRGPAIEAFVDRLFQSEGRPAQIADGGEAAHQGVGGLRGRDESGVADIVRHRGNGVGAHQHRVPMRVDQAGHQRAAAAGDDTVVEGGAAIGEVEIRSILLPVTSTFEGAVRAALLPSKMRTLVNRRLGAPAVAQDSSPSIAMQKSRANDGLHGPLLAVDFFLCRYRSRLSRERRPQFFFCCLQARERRPDRAEGSIHVLLLAEAVGIGTVGNIHRLLQQIGKILVETRALRPRLRNHEGGDIPGFLLT